MEQEIIVDVQAYEELDGFDVALEDDSKIEFRQEDKDYTLTIFETKVDPEQNIRIGFPLKDGGVAYFTLDRIKELLIEDDKKNETTLEFLGAWKSEEENLG